MERAKNTTEMAGECRRLLGVFRLTRSPNSCTELRTDADWDAVADRCARRQGVKLRGVPQVALESRAMFIRRSNNKDRGDIMC